MNDPTLHTWNKFHRTLSEKFMDLTISVIESYDQFLSLIKNPAASVLDVGCGPGNLTRYLQRKHPAWKFHAGVDAAPNMIELFSKNIPDSTVTVMDIRNIGELMASFDGIAAGFCIPFERCRYDRYDHSFSWFT